MNRTVASPISKGTAVITRPVTIIQKPIQFSFGVAIGRSKPLTTARYVNPMMKNVVQTRALRTPWMVRPW